MSATMTFLRHAPVFGRTTGRRTTPQARSASPSRGSRTVLLLVAWLFATGSHWDLIQVAAWGRMWIANAQVQPLGTAFATTFSPDAMCGVCETVQLAKGNQPNHPTLGLTAAAKAPLILPAPRAMVVQPPDLLVFLPEMDATAADSLRAAPPVPPPRPGRVVA